MTRSALLLSAAILAFTSADAYAVRVRYQGEFMVTGKAGTCPDFDPTGDFGRARFKPGIGGDTGTTSEFSVYGSRSAASYRLDSQLFNATFKTVQTMTMGDGFGPVDNVVRVRFTSQVPAAITTATDFIDIRGQISGFDFMPLCTVNFKMTLFKRVE